MAPNLPLLPLFDGAVLLPGGFLRVDASAVLVADITRRRGAAADVAAVPVAGVAELADGEDDSGALDLERVHGVGVAARVAQLQRGSDGGWVAVVEGRCRVAVEGVAAAPGEAGIYVASVRQLDYLGDAPAAGAGGKEQEQLLRGVVRGVRRLLAAARAPQGDLGARTVRVLQVSGVQARRHAWVSWLPCNRRADARVLAPPWWWALAPQTRPARRLPLAVPPRRPVRSRLQSAGPALASDVVGSLVARTPRERLALLDATDVTQRLRLVAEMLERLLLLQAGGAPETHGRPATAAAGRRADGAAPTGAAAGSDEEEEEDQGAGGGGTGGDELRAVMRRLRAATPPPEVLAAAARERARLARSSDQHPAYASVLAYLETLAEMPWGRCAAPPGPAPSLAAVRARLDADHWGLDSAKARIVEYCAVRRLRGPAAPPPVLLLVGPPGVGKTSMAASVAAALGRPFQRISLGGVRDEAEIRGHRRTYVGALPGRVAAALRAAGAADPVILLDEVDKMGRDARGDPGAALLEVLDPAQNSAFRDAYLALPLDLSKVVFLATANGAADVPPALRDRMEAVALGAYSLEERERIAARHLAPRALAAHGLPPGALLFPAPALRLLAQGYTREAGVRGLERALAGVCRHVAVQLVAAREAEEEAAGSGGGWRDGGGPGGGGGGGGAAERGSGCVAPAGGEAAADDGAAAAAGAGALRLLGPGSMELVAPAHAAAAAAPAGPRPGPGPGPHPHPGAARPLIVDAALLETVLGPPKFLGHDAAHRVSAPGAAAGLVWSAGGGEVLYVEALRVGEGREGAPGTLTLTGQAGEVLEESARIALSWCRGHAAALGLPPGGACPAARWDVHVHLPAGAVPKDGPSAGVALAVALVSLFTGRAARADVALTGELTLRGHVLAVGGLPEKLAAAAAAGMARVVVPARSLPEVEARVAAGVRAAVEVAGVQTLGQALALAFDPPLVLVLGGAEEAEAAARL